MSAALLGDNSKCTYLFGWVLNKAGAFTIHQTPISCWDPEAAEDSVSLQALKLRRESRGGEKKRRDQIKFTDQVNDPK